MVIDFVFALDSIITAVGLSQFLPVMIAVTKRGLTRLIWRNVSTPFIPGIIVSMSTRSKSLKR